jgi:hypothetical protein
MRCSFLAFVVATSVTGAVSSAFGQSIVDLSQPQKGKSRFVLNADMTPADLGAASEPAKPVAVVPRVPACGEGCKLEQPVMRRDRVYGYRDEPGSSGSRSGTGPRVIVISNVNGNQTQQAAKPAPAQRSGFRMRRR